jgi:hypothetical protein
MPFYLNRVPCYQKVRFAIRKLTCGAKKWWFEVLEYKAHIDNSLILSLANIKKIINFEVRTK